MCAVARYNNISSKADRGDIFIRAADGQMSLNVPKQDFIEKSESNVTYGQVWWPILGISALHLTHPNCTHTAVNTHPEQWAAIFAAVPGEQLGVRYLAQGHLSLGIEGGESAVHSLPVHSQAVDYESVSLNIRPQLPPPLFFVSMCVPWELNPQPVALLYH